jgi:hypothetical protein
MLSVSDVRNLEMYAAEPVMLCPSPFGDGIAIVELKGYKSPLVIKLQQNWFKQEVKY